MKHRRTNARGVIFWRPVAYWLTKPLNEKGLSQWHFDVWLPFSFLIRLFRSNREYNAWISNRQTTNRGPWLDMSASLSKSHLMSPKWEGEKDFQLTLHLHNIRKNSCILRLMAQRTEGTRFVRSTAGSIPDAVHDAQLRPQLRSHAACKTQWARKPTKETSNWRAAERRVDFVK